MFYMSKVFPDVINSYRTDWLGKHEIDVYIPSIRTGIEYDGVHWHNSQKAIKKGVNKEASIEDVG